MAEIELSNLSLDKNNFNERLSKALSTVKAPVETLIIRNNNLEASCLADIFKTRSLIQSIKTLVLSQNFSKHGDDAAQFLAHLFLQEVSPLPLQKLDVAFNSLTFEGVSPLCYALLNAKSLCNLRELNLRYNKLGAAGASCIASAIQQGVNLDALDLTGNAIGDEGTCQVMKALETPQAKIKKLLLWGNGISDSSSSHINNMLKVNRTVTNLDLSSNNLSQPSLEAIYKIIDKENLQVEYIGIHGNSIKDRLIITKFNDLATRRCHVKSVQVSGASQQGSSSLQLSMEAKNFLNQPIPVIEPLSRSEIIDKYFGNKPQQVEPLPILQQGIEASKLQKEREQFEAEKALFAQEMAQREAKIKEQVKKYIEALVAEAKQNQNVSLQVVFK